MANPTYVQGASDFAAPGVLTYSVTLAAPAGADHVVVLSAGGDKDIGGPFDPDQAGTTTEVDLRSASVSQVVAWYVAAGGETVISGDVDANIAGANLFATEYEQDGDTGTWQLVAIATNNTNETNVSAQSTGTTGAAIADGIAVATVSCDSVNTAGTPSWSNGYTARYSSPNGSTQSGLWVATLPVNAAATTETTLTRAGGTADQHSGSVIVLGKVAAPDAPGVPFLTEELGAGAVLAIEIAPGADVLGDPEVWPWVDITELVRVDPPITTTLGRGNEASTSQPATTSLVIDNGSGDFSLGPGSQYWPFIRQGVPVRVSIDPDDAGGSRVVLLAEAAGWVPSWDSLAGIPVVTLTAAGALRRLSQGQAPLVSALRRALVGLGSVVAYWPMEDGKDATVLRAFEGGQDITWTGAAKPGAGVGEFNCTAPILDAGTGSYTATLTPYAANGKSQVRMLIRVPDGGIDTNTVLLRIFTTGTLGRWDVVYTTGVGATPGSLTLNVYDAGGSLNFTDGPYDFSMDGNSVRLSVEMTQDGADVDWNWGTVRPSDLAAGSSPGTATTRSFLTVSQVQLAPGGTAGGTLMGHLTVQNDVTSLYEQFGALQAHAGEFASSGTPTISRLDRLADENALTTNRFTAVAGALHDGDRMGPQLIGPLLTLLRECELANQGQLWDGRTPGLSFTTRAYRENLDGGAALTIDAGAGELAPPWAPTHDDQRLRNKVTGVQLQGVSDVFEDVDGERGTAAVGTYDSSITVNVLLAEMALQHAAWQVSLGTQTGYRVPSITVNLRTAPHLAGAVLDLIPGDRIDVVDADTVLPGFPAGTVSLIVEGISHTIGPAVWRATFQCSPFSPWGVAEVAAETGDTGELIGRADTDGAELAAGAAAAATSLSVATTSGPLWTTATDDYPLLLSVGGLQVRATACSGTSSPQTITVDALALARPSGAAVALWDPRPLGL